MGREIRHVPQGWEHPRDDRGQYIPLIDEDYETACSRWRQECQQWYDGTHENLVEYPEDRARYEFWEWQGIPNKEVCRPKFVTEPICYQIYETVSEGTPTSPVFETLDKMVAWLIKQGYSEKAARAFAEGGWAPSMTFDASTGVLAMDIESLA